MHTTSSASPKFSRRTNGFFLFFNFFFMKPYWFVPKSYGYGFVPVTFIGWVCTLIFVGLILLSAYINGFFHDAVTKETGFRFLLDLVLLIGLFTVSFKDKVDGELKWRWGKEK
jgi:hypothetical protein